MADIKHFELHRGMRTNKFSKDASNFVGVVLESQQSLYAGCTDENQLHMATKHFDAEIARLCRYFYKPIVSMGAIEKKVVIGYSRAGKEKMIAIFTCPIEINESED